MEGLGSAGRRNEKGNRPQVIDDGEQRQETRRLANPLPLARQAADRTLVLVATTRRIPLPAPNVGRAMMPGSRRFRFGQPNKNVPPGKLYEMSTARNQVQPLAHTGSNAENRGQKPGNRRLRGEAHEGNLLLATALAWTRRKRGADSPAV